MIKLQGAATYKHRVRLQLPDGCEAYIDKGYKEGAGTALDFTPSRAFKDINGQAYEGPLDVPNPGPTTGLGGPIERVAPLYVSSALPPNVYQGENLVLFGSTLSNFTLYMLVEFIQAIIKSGQSMGHAKVSEISPAMIATNIATIVTVGNSLQKSCNAVIHYPEHVHDTWIEKHVLPHTKEAYVLLDSATYRDYYYHIINQRAKSVVVYKGGKKLWMDPVIDPIASLAEKNAQQVASYIIGLVGSSEAYLYIKDMISFYCDNLFNRIQKEVNKSRNDLYVDGKIARCKDKCAGIQNSLDKKLTKPKPHKPALKETESERKSAEDQKTYQRKKIAFLKHVVTILGDLKGRVDMRMRDTLQVYLFDLMKFLGMDQTDMLNELGWESPKVPKPSIYATHFNSIYETESTSPMVNLTYNCRFVTFYKRALTLCTIFKKTTGRGQIMHILLRHEMDLLKWPDNPSSNDVMSLALHLAINDTSSTPLWPNLDSSFDGIVDSFKALYGNGGRVNEAKQELNDPSRPDTETNVYSRKAPKIQACLDIVRDCTMSKEVNAAMIAQYAPFVHFAAILKKHRTIVTTEGNILLDLACDRATYFRLTTLAPLGEDYSPFKMGLLRNAAPIKHPPFMLRFYGTSRDYRQNDEQELAPDKIYVTMLNEINGTRTVTENPNLIKPIFMWCQLVYGFMRLRMDDRGQLNEQYSGIRILRNNKDEIDILEYTPEDNKVRIATKEAEEKANREAQKDVQIQRREALITFATDNIEEYNELTLCEDALMEKSYNENMHVPVLAFLYHMVTHRPFAHCEKIDTGIFIFSFNARALPIAMYFLEYFNDKDVIADMADIIFLANNDKVKSVFLDICPYAWPQQQFAISTDEISYNGDVPWSHARNSVFSRCLETLRQKDFACIPIAKDPERRYMHFTRFLNISPGEVNDVQSHYETDDDNEVEEETEKVKHSKGHKRGNDPIDDEAGEVEEVARPLFYLQGPMVEVKTEAKEVDDSGDGEEEASDEDEGEEEEEEAVDSGEEEESDEEEEGDEEASDTD